MSTYNGATFLKEQLASIYAQQDINFSLLVRDDGSIDNTTEILTQEQKKGNLKWYSGKNLGPANSFIQLLKDAPKADFYAFSDQDDVWLPEKLKIAEKTLLNAESEPALYFGQTQLVDRNLNKLNNVTLQPLLTYGEALIHQFIGGCTIVINDILRDILLTYTPKFIHMHDIWVYDVALAVGGKVFFDPIPQILYRQHDKNTVGQQNTKSFKWNSRIKRFCDNEHIRLKTAQELWSGYREQMPPENLELTQKIINYQKSMVSKLKLVISKDLSCSKKSVTRYAKAAIILNRF